MKPIAGNTRRGRFAVISAAIVLLVAAVLATPFLFTRQLVALALRHVFPANDPAVDRAVLSAGGVLIVGGLVIHDTGKQAGQPLLTARQTRVEFQWRELLARKLRRIAIDGLTVYARTTGSSQISMLELIPKKSTAKAAPPEIGRLEVSGTLHSEPVAGFTRTKSDWPLSLQMVAGKEAGSSRFTASIGDTGAAAHRGANPAIRESGFGALAEGESRQTATGMRLILHRVAVRRASLAIASRTLRHFVPALPDFHGPLTASLASLSGSGELGLEGTRARISGKVDFSGARIILPGDSRVKLILHDADGAVEVSTPFPPGPDTRVSIHSLRVGKTEASIEADLLRRYVGKLPAAVHGPINCTLDALDLSGDTSSIGREIKFEGPVRMQGLTARAASVGNLALAVEGMGGGGKVEVRAGGPMLAALAVRDGTVGWAALTYGNNVVSDFNAAGGLDKGVLSVDRFNARIFDGGVAGGATSVNLATRAAEPADLSIKSIDIHKALANISPDRIDAEGLVSGAGSLEVGENASLSGHLDLAFDGPGVLKVGEIPELEQKLAGSFGTDLAQLAMQDLRRYPFKQGKVHLESQGTNTLLNIRFVRQPRSGAEKSKPRKEVINGREVWVGSLVVPTIDMSIPITGKSLADILSMAAGIHPALSAAEGAGH